MVIEALGVCGDSAAPRRGRSLVARDTCDDNCFRDWIVLAGITSNFGSPRHPTHFALIGKLEPILEVVGALRSLSLHNADRIETKSSGCFFKFFRSVHELGRGK